MTDHYKDITDGLIEENVKVLRKTSDELRKEKIKLKNLRRKETLALRHIDSEKGLRKSAWFHQRFNNMEQLYYSLRRICEPVYEHGESASLSMNMWTTISPLCLKNMRKNSSPAGTR